MTHPAVRLLALAAVALAIVLALRHPPAPAARPASPPLVTTTTLRLPGYVPAPAGSPLTTTARPS